MSARSGPLYSQMPQSIHRAAQGARQWLMSFFAMTLPLDHCNQGEAKSIRGTTPPPTVLPQCSELTAFSSHSRLNHPVHQPHVSGVEGVWQCIIHGWPDIKKGINQREKKQQDEVQRRQGGRSGGTRGAGQSHGVTRHVTESCARCLQHIRVSHTHETSSISVIQQRLSPHSVQKISRQSELRVISH